MVQEGKPGRRMREELLAGQTGTEGRTPVGRANQGDKPWPPRVGRGGCNIDVTIMWG